MTHRTRQERLRIENLRRASEQGRALGPITSRLVRTDRGTLAAADAPLPPLPPPPSGGGSRPLTFAQTEAGARLAATLAQETERARGQSELSLANLSGRLEVARSLEGERIRGRERLKLEETLHALAMELLPPEDVETAMRQVRRGELVNSKLAFQAVLENLADEAAHAERIADLAVEEENEARTLRQARARITIDMIGRDVGRAILFAMGAQQ